MLGVWLLVLVAGAIMVNKPRMLEDQGRFQAGTEQNNFLDTPS
jgi:CP family cyanate transporter-like MFS transporter